MSLVGILTEKRTSADVDRRSTIAIEWCDPLIWIEPVPIELYRALTLAGSPSFQVSDHLDKALTEPGKLYDRCCSERYVGIYTLAALAPVVRHVLNRAGFSVNEVGGPARPLAPPQPVYLDPTGVVDHVLLDLVQHHDRGLIRYAPTVVNVARLIAQVAVAWPEKTLAVVASQTDRAQHLPQALRGLLPCVSLVTDEDRPALRERVVVTTDTGLDRAASCPAPGAPNDGPSAFDMVFALDALEFVGGSGLKWLITASNIRLYGLLASDVKPSRLQRDLIDAVFGFPEAVIPGHGDRVRPVCVVHYSIDSNLKMPQQPVGPTYRTAIDWRGAALQPVLLQIATAFSEDRRSELAELLPGI